MLTIRDLGLGCAGIALLILAIFFIFPPPPSCPLKTSATILEEPQNVSLRFDPTCDGFNITNTAASTIALKNFTMELEGKQRGICAAALTKGLTEAEKGGCKDIALYTLYTAEIGPWRYVDGNYTLATSKGDVKFRTEDAAPQGEYDYVIYILISVFLIAMLLIFTDSASRRGE